MTSTWERVIETIQNPPTLEEDRYRARIKYAQYFEGLSDTDARRLENACIECERAILFGRGGADDIFARFKHIYPVLLQVSPQKAHEMDESRFTIG